MKSVLKCYYALSSLSNQTQIHLAYAYQKLSVRQENQAIYSDVAVVWLKTLLISERQR